jgi:hypothetical protein
LVKLIVPRSIRRESKQAPQRMILCNVKRSRGGNRSVWNDPGTFPIRAADRTADAAIGNDYGKLRIDWIWPGWIRGAHGSLPDNFRSVALLEDVGKSFSC